jgi:putative two-component system response regulator
MAAGVTPLEVWLGRARVLVLDDEPANLEFMRHVLAPEGYGGLVALADPVQAVERFVELAPDLVITDVVMPGLDGFEVMARIQAMLPAGAYLPIVVATGDPSPEVRRRALAAGARDFLAKPLSPAEVRLRCRNLLETRFLHQQLTYQNVLLETRVADRTRELEEARTEVLLRLARAAEFRDDHTGQHALRVGAIAARVAGVLGLGADACELMGRAAPLHDVGKIGIPDAVLLKPGRLDETELRIMQAHTLIGAEILSGSHSPVLQLAEEIALNHHERWEGGGYPRGLRGEAIPLSGRIVAVADVFDSLMNERPYKRAWSARETLDEVVAQAGRQFDPVVVDAFLHVLPEVQALARDAVPGDGGRRAAPPSVAELSAMAVRLQAMEAERDGLAREVRQLRHALAGHNGSSPC